MITSYCESQISLAKNYCIFQLSFTINGKYFFMKMDWKQVAHENKWFLGKKQSLNQRQKENQQSNQTRDQQYK